MLSDLNGNENETTKATLDYDGRGKQQLTMSDIALPRMLRAARRMIDNLMMEQPPPSPNASLHRELQDNTNPMLVDVLPLAQSPANDPNFTGEKREHSTPNTAEIDRNSSGSSHECRFEGECGIYNTEHICDCIRELDTTHFSSMCFPSASRRPALHAGQVPLNHGAVRLDRSFDAMLSAELFRTNLSSCRQRMHRAFGACGSRANSMNELTCGCSIQCLSDKRLLDHIGNMLCSSGMPCEDDRLSRAVFSRSHLRRVLVEMKRRHLCPAERIEVALGRLDNPSSLSGIRLNGEHLTDVVRCLRTVATALEQGHGFAMLSGLDDNGDQIKNYYYP